MALLNTEAPAAPASPAQLVEDGERVYLPHHAAKYALPLLFKRAHPLLQHRLRLLQLALQLRDLGRLLSHPAQRAQQVGISKRCTARALSGTERRGRESCATQSGTRSLWASPTNAKLHLQSEALVLQ